jgi:hypothetical protein
MDKEKIVLYVSQNQSHEELSHEDRLKLKADEVVIWLGDTAKGVWGDDWNDAPDDCNSGSPYPETIKGLEKIIVKLGEPLKKTFIQSEIEKNYIRVNDVSSWINYGEKRGFVDFLKDKDYISRKDLSYNIGLLRQYLNERTSQDLIENKELETFLSDSPLPEIFSRAEVEKMLREMMGEKRHKEFLEICADLEHDRWGSWQKYLHSLCVKNEDGSLTIPKEKVDRWERQIKTKYVNLSEQEKESDRHQVRPYLNYIFQELKNIAQKRGLLK